MATGDMGILKKPLVGAHNVLIRDVDTHANPVNLKVLDSIGFDLAEKVVMAKGGEGRDSYAASIVDTNGVLTVACKEFNKNLAALIFHNTVTSTAADTTGFVSSTLTAVYPSTTNLLTAITAVTKHTASTLVEGVYDIVVATSSTINIYGVSDVDTNSVSYADESTGKVNTSAYTIATGTVNITELGIDFACTTTTLVPGEVARLTIRRTNAGSIDVNIGKENNKGYKEVFFFFGEPENHDLSYAQFYRCVVARKAFSPKVKDFATIELEIHPIKDNGNSGYIGKFHRTDNE